MIRTKIKELVISILKIPEEKYSEELAAGDIPEWDSLAHLALLQAVEASFKITLDVADAIEIETIEDLIVMVHDYSQTRDGSIETCS